MEFPSSSKGNSAAAGGQHIAMEVLELHEEEIPSDDPTKYCRLCLSQQDLIELFPTEGLRAPYEGLIERISSCTNIRITREEDNQSAVCWLCLTALEEFELFRNRCQRVNVLIRCKRGHSKQRQQSQQPQRKRIDLGKTVAALANEGYDVVIQDVREGDSDADVHDGDDDDIDDDDENSLLEAGAPRTREEEFQDETSRSNFTPAPEEDEDKEEEEVDVKPSKMILEAYTVATASGGSAPTTEGGVRRRRKRQSIPKDFEYEKVEGAKAPFKCTTCGKMYKMKASLFEHSLTHTGQFPFPCRDCGCAFSRARSLQAHEKRYHSKESTEDPPLCLKCEYCPRMFPRRADRLQHIKMAHWELLGSTTSSPASTPVPIPAKPPPALRETPTSSSGTRSASSAAGVEERNSKTPQLKVSTPVPMATVSPGATVEASAEAVGMQRFHCTLCADSFGTSKRLEIHVRRQHPKGAILNCYICPKTFKSRQSLRMHILNHQGKLPYECTVCGSRFDRRQYLEKHLLRYHNVGSTGDLTPATSEPCRYRCRFCPRLFQRNKDRKSHTRQVHGASLVSMMRIKQEPPEKASAAESGAQKTDLPKPPLNQEKVSVKIEPGNEQRKTGFLCAKCDGSFPTAEILREHHNEQHSNKLHALQPKIEGQKMRLKPGPKPKDAQPRVLGRFKCPYCPKSFNVKYRMKEHTFIHTGTLRYRCDECHAMFNRPKYLHNHKLKYHSGVNRGKMFRALKCPQCDRSFLRRQDLTVHLRIAHNVGIGSEGRIATKQHEHQQVLDKGGDAKTSTAINQESSATVDLDSDDIEDEVISENIPSDTELRDVVVTLERIPDDVLQGLDIPSEPDEDDEEFVPPVSKQKVTRRKRTAADAALLGIKLHRCPQCSRVFKSARQVRIHMIYHQANLPFACDECGVQFPRNRPLQLHKQRYHSEDSPSIGERFSCEYCPRIFLRARDRVFHQRTFHPRERLTILRDGGVTAEVEAEAILEEVAKKPKKRATYVCLVCCEQFSSEKACQKHLNELHPEEAKDTDDRVGSKQSLEASIESTEATSNIESMEEKIQQIKPKELEQQPQRESYKDDENKEDSNEVGAVIDSTTTDVNQPNEDVKDANVESKAPTTGGGNIAEEKVTAASTLEDPNSNTVNKPTEKMETVPDLSASQNNEEVNTMEECKEKSANDGEPKSSTSCAEVESIQVTTADLAASSNRVDQSALAQPPPSTTAAGKGCVKPYKLCRCGVCTNIFKVRAEWFEHVRNHPAVRPHHCEECLRKRNKTRKKRVFKCQHCPKTFTRASSRLVHQRLHNSELRFPCDECGLQYDRYRLLQAHKVRYHSEEASQCPPLETFSCAQCTRTFLRLKDLKVHTEVVHISDETRVTTAQTTDAVTTIATADNPENATTADSTCTTTTAPL